MASGCLKVIAGIVLLLFLALIFAQGGKDDEPQVELEMQVSAGFGGITVVNQNDFDWTDIDVTLNGRWKAHLNGLGAGQNLVIPLREFATGDGTRFNIQTTKLSRVTVMAHTEHGYRSSTGFWD